MPTILIIDDSELIRMAAAIGLDGAGWRTVSAASGDEGVELAVREHPDAILLDVVMPGLDGIATLAALRARAECASTPVVFLTARADQAPDGADAAVAGVISKPFAPAELPDQVAALLGWER